MRILLPKRDVDFNQFAYPNHIPYFYFIGPVQGGGDWQAKMCSLLHERVGDCIIAVPCRWGPEHSLAKYFIDAPITYPRQLLWEQPSIKRALTRPKSCAVCWLPQESTTNPRKDGNPYGIDTLGEMNYFRGLLEYNKHLQMVAGAEPGFPRFTQIIKPNWDYSYGKPYPFQMTMEATADAAARRVL